MRRAPRAWTVCVALAVSLAIWACGGSEPAAHTPGGHTPGEGAHADDSDDKPEPDEPDLDPIMKQAEDALAAKDFAKADRLAHEVIAHDPKGYPYAFVVLGDVQLEAHKDAQALALYDQAIALDPADGWATVRACEALDHLGQKREARERLRRYVAAHPNADADVYDALGWAELDGGDEAKGEAAFRGALKAAGGKGDEDGFYGLALVAASRGDAKGTAANLEACFAINPSRRIEASKDDGFDAVRKKPAVAALFTKKKLAEAQKAPPKPESSR